jgi:hypothetical protein
MNLQDNYNLQLQLQSHLQVYEKVTRKSKCNIIQETAKTLHNKKMMKKVLWHEQPTKSYICINSLLILKYILNITMLFWCAPFGFH